MKTKPQDMAKLASKRFGQLQRHSGQLDRLREALLPLLDPAMHTQFRIANLRDGKLVLELTSAAWATRLQYQRLDILSQLRQQGFPMLTTIEFKVNPALSRLSQPKKAPASKTLSVNASSHLEALADSIGGELGEKLKKLAAHGGRPTKRSD
ncbi:DUF721 domain-containing protein [Ferrimonas gelatinilytica]|uniref:DciA family protein n=1 Tax=Ferrimonas gelatinilytica TaxID=1255257 RepID=A0ABP9SF21_9GAMM